MTYKRLLSFLKTHKNATFVAIAMLAVGGGIGWFLGSQLAVGTGLRIYRENETNYQFIKPLLFIGTDEERALPKYGGLKQKVTAYTNQAHAQGLVDDVSVYFNELNTSQWIDVNEEERFAPASMLKVVTLMTVLRASEEDPSLLSKKVRLEGVESGFPVERAVYPPRDPVQSGQTYTVNELLQHLIVESDNGANFALSRLMGDDRIQSTYDDLQLKRQEGGEDPGYTTREYSRIFRTLYNGTYLSHSLSEQVLKLLSTTTFTEGIVSGVPIGTIVAHKFGVRSTAESEAARAAGTYTSHELHDCGIVYYPENPYFICIMTRGKNLEDLEHVLQGVSKVVWNEVTHLQ